MQIPSLLPTPFLLHHLIPAVLAAPVPHTGEPAIPKREESDPFVQIGRLTNGALSPILGEKEVSAAIPNSKPAVLEGLAGGGDGLDGALDGSLWEETVGSD